jgi:hypothetical protein
MTRYKGEIIIMKRTFVLKAKTAEGFGGKEFYTEQVVMTDTPEAIKNAKRELALKYNVEIDSVEVL